MVNRLAIACAGLLAVGGCEQATTRAVEYRPEEAGTVDHALCLLGFEGVPMRELATGHHLVEVELNGREATFVVDTGTNLSVLHAPFADRFGIAADGVTGGAIGVGGAARARQVRIESLRIGPAPIRQGRIVLVDLSQISETLGPLTGEEIAGIIGQDILGEHRAVIDVARSILYIMVADDDPAPVPADRCRPQDAAPELNQSSPKAMRPDG